MLKSEKITANVINQHTSPIKEDIELDKVWDERQGYMHRLLMTKYGRLVFGPEPRTDLEYNAFSSLPESVFTKFFVIPEFIDRKALIEFVKDVIIQWEEYREGVELDNMPNYCAKATRRLLSGELSIIDTYVENGHRVGAYLDKDELVVRVENGNGFAEVQEFVTKAKNPNIKSATKVILEVTRSLKILTKPE